MPRLRLDPLSKNFVLSKPIKQDDYDESVIYELEKQGRLIMTRKRDGWKLIVVKYRGRVKIYTDGINKIDERLGHLKKALQLKMPDWSMIVGEGIADIRNEDDLAKVQSIMKSKLERAREIQKDVGPLKLMVFDVVFWGGWDVTQLAYYSNSHLQMIQNYFRGGQYVMPVEIVNGSFDNAKKLVIQNGWEGLVLYDREFRLSFRVDGRNPERPEGCWKWKPIIEDDFIIGGWRAAKDNPAKFKDVELMQIDPRTGQKFSCGRFGGFNGEMKKFLTEKAQYPLVMQFKFDGRFLKTGKIRDPKFIRLREDKKPQDCIASKSYPQN